MGKKGMLCIVVYWTVLDWTVLNCTSSSAFIMLHTPRTFQERNTLTFVSRTLLDTILTLQ
jgi:hypothetical protein